MSSQVFVCLDYVWILDFTFVNKRHLGSHYARLQWTARYRIHDQQNEPSSFTPPLYVADFCELSHCVNFNDVTLKDIFRLV